MSKDCNYCKYVNFETPNPQDRNKLLDKPSITNNTTINGNEMLELEFHLGYFGVKNRRKINFCPMCGEELYEREKIAKGDLVIKRGKHEAMIYIVEDIDESGILLVNGIQDAWYESDEFSRFSRDFRLYAKAKDLIDDELTRVLLREEF